MTSLSRSFLIQNELGLHARAATKLVQLVSKFPCEVELVNGEHRANAKSVMGLLLLCSGQGASLHAVATGARAEECLDAIGELVDGLFGESS